MAKKNNGAREGGARNEERVFHQLHPDTKKSVWAIVFFALAVLLGLAGAGYAGPVGGLLFRGLTGLVGWGYAALPISAVIVAGVFLFSERRKFIAITLIGASALILAVLGLIDLFAPTHGGWLGYVLGALKYPFGEPAAVILNCFILVIALLVTLNVPLRWKRAPREQDEEIAVRIPEEAPAASAAPEEKEQSRKKEGDEPAVAAFSGKAKRGSAPRFKDYVPPPQGLLKSSTEKPTTGDLRANANIIRRTLESFGIQVEMGEVNIGPKVTRYTLKPAEGMKLSRITALNQDLALALAAHPIRIEAPIPGKSLVGIEVPNKAAALVRLGSIMGYPEFNSSGPLGFVVGRDVTGEPIFADIEKMPHLLIAGATGSGKSVMIHSLIVSLLYKNSPQMLKLILVDPKRVELSVYEGIPHLVSPVITQSKKAAGGFRWAISEMERRYEVLQAAGSRDVKSYNANGGKDDPLPYLVIMVDELADLMTAYGREVEGSVVRLAQMARATGIHLVLATQRPSVEIITGLIKANITSRIALQVASQVDSRTILDTAGAEKLLGGGDLLFTSSELSKPKRIQGAYLTEEEITSVADFIRKHNQAIPDGEGTPNFSAEGGAAEGAVTGQPGDMFDEFADHDDDDELYDDAVRIVGEAQKASASLLQRRLKVGYARAARLLDIMEEKGVIGPGDGAKPRDVFIEKIGDKLVM